MTRDVFIRPTLVPTRQRWITWRDYETMGSTDREIPYIGREEEPAGTWVGLGTFAGEARLFDEHGDLVSESVSGTWDGVVALTIVGQDVLYIVSPPSKDDPAVWFWVTRSHLAEVSAGEIHTSSRERPRITIRGQGWRLDTHEVARLEHPCWAQTLDLRNSLEAGGESGLLDALAERPLKPAEQSSHASAEPVTKIPDELRAVVMRSVASGAALVPVREKRLDIHSLGMGAMDTETPFDLNEAGTPTGTWFCIGTFVGEAHPLILEADPKSATLGVVTDVGDATTGTVSGPTALTVVAGRLLGIVAPESGRAVWLSIWKDEIIEIDAEGSRGFLRKRPEAIGFQTEQWSLVIRQVARRYPPCTAVEARTAPRVRRDPRAQPWQEASLLEALTS